MNKTSLEYALGVVVPGIDPTGKMRERLTRFRTADTVQAHTCVIRPLVSDVSFHEKQG